MKYVRSTPIISVNVSGSSLLTSRSSTISLEITGDRVDGVEIAGYTSPATCIAYCVIRHGLRTDYTPEAFVIYTVYCICVPVTHPD